MNLVPALAAAALGYFVFIKPTQDRKKKAQAAPAPQPKPQPMRPRIIMGPECSWEIPNTWWTDVAQPAFAAFVAQNTQGMSSTQAAQEASNWNSQDVTRGLLLGELPENCTIPFSLGPNSTAQSPKEQNLINLFKFVLNRVQGGLINFIESDGTQVQLQPQ
ncbi:MAG: hypothetical protein KAJ42_10810 [Gemmatimonadetes bacterium]|nr:hypothetical protein [Gemmatimonadota bacterium]